MSAQGVIVTSSPIHNDLYDFFMQAPIPMLVLLGPKHRFAIINPQYQQFFGKREVLGKNALEAFTEDEIGDFVKLLDHVYRTGESHVGQEMPLDLPDDEGIIRRKYLSVSYHPFREPDGTIKGIIATHQDVTEQVVARRKVEMERLNFRNLFKQTPEIVCILTGPKHVFEFVNAAHIKLLGFDATGMAVLDAQPESTEVHGLLDEVYQTGKTVERRELPVTVSDRIRYFDFTYAARRDEEGRVDGVMILAIEVTDQVKARETLRKAVNTRDEFLSIASHELKTPITSLKMNVQLMERKLKRDTDVKTLVDYCLRSDQQVTNLSKLVDDLLDISKIEAGKLTYYFERTDFSKLYREVIERFGYQLQSSGVEIKSDIEPNLIGHWDKGRLEQVIVNLVSNSIKYAPGSPIEITAKSVGDNAVISIRDFGRGVPSSKSQIIFERFERSAESKNISGLGLGLYISRQIVHGHGGTIELDPSVHKGARFVVTIPFAPENAKLRVAQE